MSAPVNRKTPLFELFSAIKRLSSSLLCTIKISGETRPVAAVRMPFADRVPDRSPTGIPITQSISTWAVTRKYSCLFSPPMARKIPYCPIRMDTAIFRILQITNPAAKRSRSPTIIPAASIKENPWSDTSAPPSSQRIPRASRQGVLYIVSNSWMSNAAIKSFTVS